ncbi:hypothetical protein JJE66_33875 [Bradyrhizobium diazoefficiens]|uniref:hypothetical protein n=1 Tax=Bradyrhizobium diazoefficiens TaxID=1355477 RepID=UPI00190A0C65|nr:hypothetical protein [Bradyrhizobium diazoefficiens]MBK3666198.1 hypothetical protein [Bradyrhizobium diazoefficiens]
MDVRIEQVTDQVTEIGIVETGIFRRREREVPVTREQFIVQLFIELTEVERLVYEHNHLDLVTVEPSSQTTMGDYMLNPMERAFDSPHAAYRYVLELRQKYLPSFKATLKYYEAALSSQSIELKY